MKKKFFSGRLFRAGRLLIWRKIPPGLTFRTGRVLGSLEYIVSKKVYYLCMYVVDEKMIPSILSSLQYP